MKKLECIIQNRKLAALEDALRAAGVGGMTVSEVKGFGNEQTRPDSYLFLPKTKVEVYCADAQVETLLDAIAKSCRTGQLGDGKVIVTDISDALRVRTGQRGEEAL